jgi:hypothetical protein
LGKKLIKQKAYPSIGIDVKPTLEKIRNIILQILLHSVPLLLNRLKPQLYGLYIRFAASKRPKIRNNKETGTQIL